MINELTLLELGSESSSTRQKIIQALSDKWPLTSKELYNHLKTHFSLESSYQSVHKTMLQMVEDGTLEKDGKIYRLSKDWITNLKKFSTNLENKYANNKKSNLENGNSDTKTLIFNDFSECVTEMAKLFASSKLVGKNSSIGIGLLRHAWWPLRFSFMDFALAVSMLKNNNGGYAVVQEDTPFDKWTAKQYLAAGFLGAKIGVKDLNLDKEIVIHGEHIVEVKYSQETRKMLDDVYRETHDLGDLFKQYVKQAISKTPNHIEVTITRKPELAALMQKQLIEKYFGSEAKK